MPVSKSAHTSALTAGDETGRPIGAYSERQPGSAHCGSSRAVGRNRSIGNPVAFRVQADRFDHEIKLAGAVDLARYAVGHVGPDEQGFGEVLEPMSAPCSVVLHEEHGVRRIFHPRDQNEVIGAEVEHAETRRAGAMRLPPASAAPLWS